MIRCEDITCSSLCDLLDGFHGDRAVAGHLADCEHCAERLAALRRQGDALRLLARPPSTPDATFARAVLGRALQAATRTLAGGELDDSGRRRLSRRRTELKALLEPPQ